MIALWHDEHKRLLAIEAAAWAFIDSMGDPRMSGVYGREVPQGFTSGSGKAAVALWDALLPDDPSRRFPEDTPR